MKSRHSNRFLAAAVTAMAAVAFFTPNSHAADVTLTGATAINGMNTNYTVNSPDALILDFTGVGGNRSSDTMGAAIAITGANLTIAGNGTLRVTGNSTDVLGIGNVSGGGRVVNISLGSGGLIDIQGGAFVNGGWGGGTWTNNLADMNIASGAVFDFWDGGIRVDALTGAGSLQNGSNSSPVHSLVVGVDGGSGTFSGVIGGGTNRAGQNKISLTKEGVGTQTLSGTHTYTGETKVDKGTLLVSGAGSINSSSAITVAATGKLVYNSSTVLTKAVTLSGNGVANRAVLGGTGPIGVNLGLNNVGDVLSPGNSPGIQSLTVSQTWSAMSYDWEVNDFTGTTAGTAFDQIAITGTLNLTPATGSYILNVLSLDALNAPGNALNFSETTRTWDILTATSITGFDDALWTINVANFTNAEAGTWSLAQVSNNLVLTYTAVPEPGAALLGGLGLLALLRRRR